jgi:hypothetical protein
MAEICHELSDIGPRVACWMRSAYPDCVAKRAARDFDVSERQAQRWAGGEKPTSEHLTQMARHWGWRFVHFVFEGVLPPPTEAIHDSIDTLRAEIAALRQDLRGDHGE